MKRWPCTLAVLTLLFPGVVLAQDAPEVAPATPPDAPRTGDQAAERLGFAVSPDAPLEINSGELEVKPDRGGGRRVVFRQDVIAVQSDLRLSCDWLEAAYPKSGAGNPERVTARGHVRIVQAANTALCQEAVFDNLACTATCTGASQRARLQRGDDVIEADRIQFDLCKGLVKASGDATVRVQGRPAAE